MASKDLESPPLTAEAARPLKRRVRARLKLARRRRERQQQTGGPPPRHDAAFFAFQAWLDRFG